MTHLQAVKPHAESFPSCTPEVPSPSDTSSPPPPHARSPWQPLPTFCLCNADSARFCFLLLNSHLPSHPLIRAFLHLRPDHPQARPCSHSRSSSRSRFSASTVPGTPTPSHIATCNPVPLPTQSWCLPPLYLQPQTRTCSRLLPVPLAAPRPPCSPGGVWTSLYMTLFVTSCSPCVSESRKGHFSSHVPVLLPVAPEPAPGLPPPWTGPHLLPALPAS